MVSLQNSTEPLSKAAKRGWNEYGWCWKWLNVCEVRKNLKTPSKREERVQSTTSEDNRTEREIHILHRGEIAPQGWQLILGGQKFYISQWFVDLQSSSLSNKILSLVINFYIREKLVILWVRKRKRLANTAISCEDIVSDGKL